MKRRLAILLLSIGSIAGCKIHRLPALPAERDPSNEQGAVVPYRPPPDVLTTELSTGTDTPTGHEGHDMGGPKGTSRSSASRGAP